VTSAEWFGSSEDRGDDAGEVEHSDDVDGTLTTAAAAAIIT